MPRTASRCSIAIPSALQVKAAVGLWLIDQPTTRRRTRQHDGAVDLALTGWVLGDVGQPELVRAARRNCRSTRSSAVARPGTPRHLREPLRPAIPARCISIATALCPTLSRGRARARRRRAWRHSCRRRRHGPRGSVGQPGVPHRSRRGRPAAPSIVPRAGHPERSAGGLDRQPLAGDHRDRLEPPFGRTYSFSSSVARRCTASSVSSARIRRRAARSSSRSAELSPGSSP